MRKIALLLILATVLGCSSCRHNIDTTNPKVVVASALADASNTCKTLEDALVAANRAVEKVEAKDPGYYAKAKPLLQKISSANKVAAHKIQQAKNDGVTEWRSAFVAIAGSVTPEDLAALQVKNPDSQVIIGTSIAGVVAIIEAIGGAR